MANNRDILRLNKEKVFEKIKKCLPENINEPLNIIECQDDILFIWNCKDCSVLSLNIKAVMHGNEEVIKYQTLLFSNPPVFKNVLYMRQSFGEIWLGIFGDNGASLLQLPKRWGPNGYYLGGKDIIICRAIPVDERYFLNRPSATLVQARWHPGSFMQSYLVILTSENSLRLYNADPSEIKLLQIWQFGHKPYISSYSLFDISCNTDVDNKVVDFDFVTPELQTKTETINHNKSSVYSYQSSNSNISVKFKEPSLTHKINRKIVCWPIAVLKNHGDIYLVSGRLDTQQPEITKPLFVFPNSSCKYALNCCALLVLQSHPPTFVVAESSGIIHHCILMKNRQSGSATQVGHTLHTVESVKLQFGLNLYSTEATKVYDLYAIKLIVDTVDSSRYLVYHGAGVHAVAVSFFHQLQDFLVLDCDVDPKLHPPVLNPSNIEYILCTNLSRNLRRSRIFGLSILGSSSSLIVLLPNGDVLTLSLPSAPCNYTRWKRFITNSVKESASQGLKVPFHQQIQRILKSKTTQPILKLGKDISVVQGYNVATRFFKTFRAEYFPKHREARDQIDKRLHVLQLLQTNQIKEINFLVIKKVEIQNKDKELRRKYESVQEKQKQLTKRSELLLRLSGQCFPKIIQAESNFFNNIKQAEIKLNSFKTKFSNIKDAIRKQNIMIKHYEQQEKDRNLHISDDGMKNLKIKLQRRTTQINVLLQNVRLIKNCLHLE